MWRSASPVVKRASCGKSMAASTCSYAAVAVRCGSMTSQTRSSAGTNYPEHPRETKPYGVEVWTCITCEYEFGQLTGGPYNVDPEPNYCPVCADNGVEKIGVYLRMRT